MVETDMDKLTKRHELYAIFLPGFFLTVVSFFILFYPSFLRWDHNILNITIIVIIILGISYVFGIFVHTSGKLIEKVFIEKLLNLDLKRIGKIHWIVGESKSKELIKKYGLDIKETSYWKNWCGIKTLSEEKWSARIKELRSKTNDEVKRENINSFNRHNKLTRGIITDSLVLFLVAWYKYGTDIMFVEWYHAIILGTSALVFGFVWEMLSFEKRELQIVYNDNSSKK